MNVWAKKIKHKKETSSKESIVLSMISWFDYLKDYDFNWFIFVTFDVLQAYFRTFLYRNDGES